LLKLPNISNTQTPALRIIFTKMREALKINKTMNNIESTIKVRPPFPAIPAFTTCCAVLSYY